MAKNLEQINLEQTNFEQKYVHDVYNAIAPHFSHTRYRGWPKIEQYLINLPDNTDLLDIGCGNGKYLGYNDKCNFVGMDMSDELLNICRKKGYEVVYGNVLSIPFSSNSFDNFICIAVLHHLSTDERRVCALKEMARILKVNGEGLIYVWSFEYGGQKKNKKIVLRETQDSLIEWNIPKHILHTSSTDDKPIDTIFSRYYHMFKEGELEILLQKVPELTVVKSYLDQQNWVVVVRKTVSNE